MLLSWGEYSLVQEKPNEEVVLFEIREVRADVETALDMYHHLYNLVPALTTMFNFVSWKL